MSLVLTSGLVGLIVVVGIVVSYIDIQKQIILNKIIFPVAGIGFVTNSLICAMDYGISFHSRYYINLILGTLFSLFFYIIHIWAAGDSKLMMTYLCLIPERIYSSWPATISFVYLMLFVFLTAYIFLLLETIYLAVSNKKDIFGRKTMIKNVAKMLPRYIQGVLLFRIIFFAFYKIKFPAIFTSVGKGMVAVCLVLFVNQYIKKYSNYVIFILLIINVFLREYRIGNYSIKYLFFLSALWLVRYWLGKYNYQEIEVNHLKSGMILSCATISLFLTSRVKILPNFSFEDNRSKLTEEEVEAVRRWSKTKKGFEKVIIVRKMPFAVFLSIGVLLFCIIKL